MPRAAALMCGSASTERDLEPTRGTTELCGAWMSTVSVVAGSGGGCGSWDGCGGSW